MAQSALPHHHPIYFLAALLLRLHSELMLPDPVVPIELEREGPAQPSRVASGIGVSNLIGEVLCEVASPSSSQLAGLKPIILDSLPPLDEERPPALGLDVHIRVGLGEGPEEGVATELPVPERNGSGMREDVTHNVTPFLEAADFLRLVVGLVSRPPSSGQD